MQNSYKKRAAGLIDLFNPHFTAWLISIEVHFMTLTQFATKNIFQLEISIAFNFTLAAIRIVIIPV